MRTSSINPARLFQRLRLWQEAVNGQLAAFYRLCSREESASLAQSGRIILMRRGEVFRLHKTSEAGRVEVRSGTIWLTGSPDEGDVILKPGECFKLTGNVPVVIESLTMAQVTLLA